MFEVKISIFGMLDGYLKTCYVVNLEVYNNDGDTMDFQAMVVQLIFYTLTSAPITEFFYK